MVNLVPVESSNLRAVGYDHAASILIVEFRNGALYHYFNVPLAIYEGLLNAASKGAYLDSNVKKAGFPYQRVG